MFGDEDEEAEAESASAKLAGGAAGVAILALLSLALSLAAIQTSAGRVERATAAELRVIRRPRSSVGLLCLSHKCTLARKAYRTRAMGFDLLPRELDKLHTLHVAGTLAQKRLARGVRLNEAEATALIANVLHELIRDGNHSVAELMAIGACPFPVQSRVAARSPLSVPRSQPSRCRSVLDEEADPAAEEHQRALGTRRIAPPGLSHVRKAVDKRFRLARGHWSPPRASQQLHQRLAQAAWG